MPNTVDGALSLDEQNNALNFHQKQHRCKVVDYQKDQASTVAQNIATCQQLPLGDPIPTLRLVEIPTGSTRDQVKPAGTTPTFDGIVFVNSTATHVAGFHGN